MLPFELTKDTPYLSLSGELWSVFYEYFNKNWPCYKGFLLYNCVVTVVPANGLALLGARASAVTVMTELRFCFIMELALNTLRPRQNGRHFADAIFKCIFLHENVWIPIKIWLGCVPKGQINNILALVQIMAWRRPGDKPLSEPMPVSLLAHIYVTRPQWVNSYLLFVDRKCC